MDRRDFMKGILAAGVAPAIVKAENIMRINPQIIDTPPSKLILPPGVDLREVAELTIHSTDGRILGRVPLGYDGAPYRESEDFGSIRQPLIPLKEMVMQESGYATHMTLEMPDPLNRSLTRKFHQPIQSHGFNLSSRQVMTGMSVKMTPFFVVIR